jgi:hypothetical protein
MQASCSYAKMTGDRMKILMLTLPFMVRDLITPEVFEYSSIYPVIACFVKYIRVYTRLNSSTQQSTRPSPDPVCTACLTSLIPAMRLWRYSQHLAVWSGSHSFSEGRCVHAVILLICQQNVFMALILRYAIVH